MLKIRKIRINIINNFHRNFKIIKEKKFYFSSLMLDDILLWGNGFFISKLLMNQNIRFTGTNFIYQNWKDNKNWVPMKKLLNIREIIIFLINF
jgi:hypothetical protein